MRHLSIALASVLIALVAATAAYAAADNVQGTVEILKGSTVIATYTSAMTPCTATTSASACEVDVSLGNRDFLRLRRACATHNAVTLQIFSTRSFTCAGDGQFNARFTGKTYDCSGGTCVATAANPAIWATIVATQ